MGWGAAHGPPACAAPSELSLGWAARHGGSVDVERAMPARGPNSRQLTVGSQLTVEQVHAGRLALQPQERVRGGGARRAADAPAPGWRRAWALSPIGWFFESI